MTARLDARLERNVDHPVVLALSGGGDSMALLLIAAGWANSAGRRLLAITVDHGLSPAGQDWNRFCRAAARAVGVDWIERRWEGDKPVAGLPAAARRARHALIGEAAREAGAKVVLLAHTADDIAESDWMRARGSTLGSLREWAPSPAWPEGRGLMLFRPMLGEGRDNLRAVLRESGKAWIEDPANEDERFGRSRARKSLALLPSQHAGSCGETEQERDSRPRPGAANLRLLPLGVGFEVDRSVSGRLLATLLVCASGSDRPPRRERLEALAGHLRAAEDWIATLSGTRIAAVGDSVSIAREPGEMRRHSIPDVHLVRDRPAVWDGRYEVIAREPGWTVTAALGRLNALSGADRAIVDTFPARARAALPVLIRDGSAAPVLAWRTAEVRSLAPRRLALALGETTQECDLYRTIHGETPPTDLF